MTDTYCGVPGNTHKKLIIFCDGTWNCADQKSETGRPCPTNVTRLFEATLPVDSNGNPQIVHYIQGVGTRKLERLRGGGFGFGISDNIKNAYQFICSNYQPGDEIFLFGFSRGAFTARSIAGFIHNMGILKRTDFYLVNEAFDKYRDRSPAWHPDSQEAKQFRANHTWGNEEIAFVGVWDTVGALGVPFGFVLGFLVSLIFKTRFHDVKLSSTIKSGYHALAIDERRWPFRPTLWELNPKHNPANFEEKWFPGVHANVGGGYPDTGLSDIALDWMAKKALVHGLEIDLSLVSNPPLKADISLEPEESQCFLYRLATQIFVKFPAYAGIVIPEQNRHLVRHIQANGDYLRPIANRNDVSNEAMQKIKQGSYSPPNV